MGEAADVTDREAELAGDRRRRQREGMHLARPATVLGDGDEHELARRIGHAVVFRHQHEVEAVRPALVDPRHAIQELRPGAPEHHDMVEVAAGTDEGEHADPQPQRLEGGQRAQHEGEAHRRHEQEAVEQVEGAPPFVAEAGCIGRCAQGDEAVGRQDRDGEDRGRAVAERHEQRRDRLAFADEQRDEQRDMEDDEPDRQRTGDAMQLDPAVEAAEHRLDRRMARAGEDGESHQRQRPQDGELHRRPPRPQRPFARHLDLGGDPQCGRDDQHGADQMQSRKPRHQALDQIARRRRYRLIGFGCGLSHGRP